MLNVLKEYSKRGKYDEVWTPAEALKPLISYLHTDLVIWDCAPGAGILVSHLRNFGYNVVDWEGDFIKDNPPEYDVIVTNPPFSVAEAFLKRANSLGQPWCMLMPITKLGSKRCRVQLKNVEIVFPDKRIDFTGKRAPWFYSAWYTMGLNIGKQLVI